MLGCRRPQNVAPLWGDGWRLLGNHCGQGQGTTEYAILVGVLVVIAIVAIVAFKDKVSQLWDAIASGINSL